MNGRLLKISADAWPVRLVPSGLRVCKANGIDVNSRFFRCQPLLCRARSPVEELEMEGEDNEPSMQAEVPYNLGYSFTPGGLLVPYYIGVVGALKNLGLIGPLTPVSGSSAGAICAALIASGLDYKDCLEANRKLQLEILQNGTFQKLHGPLRNSMMDTLPDDIHLRANGRIGIAVTVYHSLPTWKPMEGKLLDTYESKSDLVDAIVASCYIPYYLGPAPGLQYRGEICSDGLPTKFFPEVLESSKHIVDQTVTVSAMPYRNRFFRNGPGVDISPDNRPEAERFSAWGYVQRGVLAYSLDDLDLLASQGYEDASNWGETFLSRRILERAGVL